MGPPSTQSFPQEQHDSRAASNQQASSASVEPVINPARAALISGDSKGDRDRRRERDPRNDERNAPASGPGPDNRINGRHEPSREQGSRTEQDAPTGPRASRNGRELINEPTRSRATREPASSESNYGRLNGPNNAPAPDTPSGPRAPNGPAGRAGRNFTAPGPNMHGRNESAAPSPAPARTPRDFPGRNEQPPFGDRQTSTPQPSTPAADGPPMHPSRMAKFEPTPIQTNNTPNGGSHNAVSPTGPPSGPRSNRLPAGTPTGPSPASGPPSGPAGPERKRSDRQRANINATLQGAGSPANAIAQGTQFRGAARSTSYTAASPSAAVPSGPPADLSSRRDAPGNQPDLFSARGEDNRESRSRRYEDDRGDVRQRGSRHPSRERRGDEEPPRRAPPQAMDNSRDSGRGDDRRGRDERSGRDGGRDRRPGREDEHPRRPLPDVQGSFSSSGPVQGQPPPPPPPPGPPPAPEWERGPSRRDNQSFDNRRGGRGGGGGDFRGPRREEDRNGGRGPSRQDDLMQPQGADGRKRRHEDGPGGPAPGNFDPKRRRSGR
jgi:THO complex subunit 2